MAAALDTDRTDDPADLPEMQVVEEEPEQQVQDNDDDDQKPSRYKIVGMKK